MPYKKSYKKRRNYSKLRDKKINTLIEKRIDEISKKNIAASTVYHYYDKDIVADGQSWTSPTELPLLTSYRPIAPGSLENKAVSDFGGLISDTFASSLDSQDQRSITVGIKGIQCRFGFVNTSQQNARVTAQLIWIPNLNQQTDDAVDFLRPDVYMLYKYGSGNILYDGWSKGQLKNLATSPQTVRTYSVLARKTFNLRGIDSATATEEYVGTKRVTLQKVWKNLRKHNIKDNSLEGMLLTDGNYYFTIHSDLAVSGLQYIGATTVKFQMLGTTVDIAS